MKLELLAVLVVEPDFAASVRAASRHVLLVLGELAAKDVLVWMCFHLLELAEILCEAIVNSVIEGLLPTLAAVRPRLLA